MTEAQGVEFLAKLDQILFCAQVCATGVGVLLGAYTWRVIVLAKNQRSIW
jgi:hypothetical protein